MARRKKRAKTKRRRPNVKKRVAKTVQSQWRKISTGAGALAFLSQVTGSDMAASTGQPIGARAQNFINSLSGRITGYTPFKSAAGANTPQTISIDGMFNKWSGIGLGTWIYGMLPVKQLPHKAKAKTLGKSLLSGGVLGGLFSVGNPHNTNLLSPTRSMVTSTSEVSYT
tara:strand:+ start:324 stop:830 length:507 start_codon:yes stop_codon:yes gene_type:complete